MIFSFCICACWTFVKLPPMASGQTSWRGATHPLGLLGRLVPGRQHHIAGAVARGGAAGRGVGGGGGARAAGVLLGIMGVAAVQRLRAPPQERVAVAAAGSRSRALAAAALEAGAAPHGAGARDALPGYGGNQRSREVVRVGGGAAELGGILGRHHGGRWRWGGGRGAGEGEVLALLLEQVPQPLVDALHAVFEVLAHLSEGGVLRQGRDPLQFSGSWPRRLHTGSRLWTSADPLHFPPPRYSFLALLTSCKQQEGTVPSADSSPHAAGLDQGID